MNFILIKWPWFQQSFTIQRLWNVTVSCPLLIKFASYYFQTLYVFLRTQDSQLNSFILSLVYLARPYISYRLWGVEKEIGDTLASFPQKLSKNSVDSVPTWHFITLVSRKIFADRQILRLLIAQSGCVSYIWTTARYDSKKKATV